MEGESLMDKAELDSLRHAFVADDLDPENKLGPASESSRITGCLECTEDEGHPLHRRNDGSPVSRARFSYSGADDERYRAVDGQWVMMLGELDPSEYERAETGPMYRFRADNGFAGDAFADELKEEHS